ncbi:MAG: arylesterase [Gammaproteobacteria bacterium]|nr:arylesterase [Gammaproteobacteria bacterium]MDH5803421.1 arylesterase [Gammaproteobacteria bacterium]
MIFQSITPKKLRYFPALFFCLTLLAACGGKNQPLLPKLAPGSTILSFGDSLTFGTGANPQSSYPALLQQLSGLPVINAGKPGEISADGVQRLPALLDQHQPALLILCHGGNDMLRKKNLSETQSHLRDMIREAKSRGVAVVLLGVPKPKLLSLKPAAFYQELATELQVPFEAEIIAEVLSDSDLKSDPIHPNAKGYARIATAVHKLLISTKAL